MEPVPLLHPVQLAWADAGSADELATWAASLKIEPEIVRERDAHAFEVLPRRWVVERTLAWTTAHRRRARDYETVARKLRGHDPVGSGRPDNPAPRHPEAVSTKSSTYLDVS